MLEGSYKIRFQVDDAVGRSDDRGALPDAIALAGKRSLRLTAVLKLTRPA